MSLVYAFIDDRFKWQLLKPNQLIAYNKFEKYRSATMQTMGSSPPENVYYSITFSDDNRIEYNYRFSEEDDSNLCHQPIYIQLGDTQYHKILDISKIMANNSEIQKNIKMDKFCITLPITLHPAIIPTVGGSFRKKYNKTKKTKKLQKKINKHN